MRVAFIGSLHAGKTSAANELIRLNKLNGNVMPRISFAQPLKDLVQDFIEDDMDITIDMNEFKKTPEGRTILQTVGAIGRNKDEDYWVNRAFFPHMQSAVVDDCRFLNEAAHLRKNEFTLVRLERPDGAIRASVVAVLREQNPELSQEEAEQIYAGQILHASETEQYSIETDRTIHAIDMPDLLAQVGNLYKELS